jgi:hypothetical protein
MPSVNLAAKICSIALFALCLAGCGRTSADTSQSQTPPNNTQSGNKLHLWVAPYYYPNGPGLDEWNRLIAAAKRVPIVAIVNPASGPGDHQDSYFAAVLPRARQAGITLVGYIGTKYGKKPLADAEQEVETYLNYYPDLQGFHFDEQSSDAKDVDYYAALYAYVRKRVPSAVVLTNPGTLCVSDYVSRPASDVVCLFESNNGFGSFQPPSWTSKWPANRFCIQAYQVANEALMKQYLEEAIRKRIGYVYITDAGGTNPYSRLPSYWSAAVNAIEQVNKTFGLEK